MVNLNLYKIFKVVAEEKKISKASEKLYISQPAVSFAIKELEKSLDTLYTKTVPAGVREFIDMRSGAVSPSAVPKPKKPKPPKTEHTEVSEVSANERH